MIRCFLTSCDAGEKIIDTVDFSLEPESNEDDSNEEKVEPLVERICRAGDEAAAALFVLMGTMENSKHPKLFGTNAPHQIHCNSNLNY